MAGRKKGAAHISEPDSIPALQERLVAPQGFKQSLLQVFPEVRGNLELLDEILAEGGLKGLDLEFDADAGSARYLRPSIVAVTTLDKVFSAPWSEAIASRLHAAFTKGAPEGQPPYHWVAHSTCGADKAVIEEALDIQTDIGVYSDSMATHYLANMHLAKSPNKDESDDSGSLGFNDLWTTASLVLDVSRWKGCRGAVCPGSDVGTPGYSRLAPCPTHSPMSYCGIDAWVSPVTHVANMKILESMGLKNFYYRDFMSLLQICHDMQMQGVRVNLAHILESNKILEEEKAKLFPFTGTGKKRVYESFNPQSGKQTIAYFKSKGVTLTSTDKAAIQGALEERAYMEGLDADANGVSDEDLGQASPVLKSLNDLLLYKTTGKGLDPWYDEKYFGTSYHQTLASLGVASIYDLNGVQLDAALGVLAPHSVIHPRFQAVGTSSGRKSSSAPNLQNMKKGGFGVLVRRAIIPHRDDEDMTAADYQQLELRHVLYLAGKPYSGSDAFTWLVKQSEGQFHEAAKLALPKKFELNPDKAARDLSKVASHSCLTGEHEVLTPKGWIRIDEWRGQPIYEWDLRKPSGFKTPLGYHTYGKSQVYTLRGERFSQVVTKTHRIPVFSPWEKYDWQFNDVTPGTWDYAKDRGDYIVGPVEWGGKTISTKDVSIEPQVELQDVYCFTTSTGYFLTRHNGHVSVTGNSNYGVGMVMLSPSDLKDRRTIKTIEAGALRVYHPDFMPGLGKPWLYHGRQIAFTGSHLAEILFKDKSEKSRAKALAIQEDIYFKRFFEIREWQMRVLQDAERRGYAQLNTGRFLRLFGMPEETAKVVLAFYGQGGGAEHVQGIEILFRKEQNRIPLLQVHDELVFCQPKSLTDQEVICYIRLMEGETPRFPGFTCPVEVKRGPNYQDMETIYKG